MSTEEKPREYANARIYKNMYNGWEMVADGIHVIEYSAYEALEKELKQFKQFKEFADDDGRVEQSVYESAVKGRRDFRQAFKESQEEIARLEAELAQVKAHAKALAAALEFYANPDSYDTITGIGKVAVLDKDTSVEKFEYVTVRTAGKTAREALAAWKEYEK